MIKRPLMFPEEIMGMPIGNYIVIKTGGKTKATAMETKLPLFSDYCKVYPPYIPTAKIKLKKINVLDRKKRELYHCYG